MAIAFAVTFLLRFLTASFNNDHFTHLSRARQILSGEWPIRDFFDPGQFLHDYVSAAAQVVFGYNLFGEALVTAACLALGAALTYGVSVRLAGSRTIGACAALTTVLAFPRLYNYPKVFLYVAAIWLAWWYAHGQSRRRIATLAAFSALAFLFRYDHGAYVAGLMIVLLTLVHAGRPRQWLTALAVYVGLFCVLLAPFAVYVQWAAGLPQYIAASRTPARFVRGIARRSADVRFTLGDSTPPAAEPAQAQAASPAPRVTGVLTPDNALAWFISVTLAVPLLALLVGVWAWARGTIARPEAATVVAAACLCLVITRTLMLDDPPQRLADVISPVAVLGAWLAGRWLTAASPHPRPWSLIFRHLTLASVFIATVWSIATQARFVNRLDDADVFMGPRATWAALEDTYRRLHLRPIDDWAPPGRSGSMQLLGRYVLRCTSPDDRLLVAGQFAPQIYFYTERAFAGGQVHFMAGWHDTVQDQRLTLERLVHEHVPIALIGDEEATFRRRFSLVAEYVDGHYVEVPFARGNGSWRVLVERDRVPAGTDAELGLPCYVPHAGA